VPSAADRWTWCRAPPIAGPGAERRRSLDSGAERRRSLDLVPSAADRWILVPSAADRWILVPSAAGPWILVPSAAGPWILVPSAAGPWILVAGNATHRADVLCFFHVASGRTGADGRGFFAAQPQTGQQGERGHDAVLGPCADALPLVVRSEAGEKPRPARPARGALLGRPQRFRFFWAASSLVRPSLRRIEQARHGM
jgi:hypothetical protein